MKKRIITVAFLTGLSIATLLSTPQAVHASTYRNYLQNYVNNQQATDAPANQSVNTPSTIAQPNEDLGNFWTNRRAGITTLPSTPSAPTQQLSPSNPSLANEQSLGNTQSFSSHTVSQRELEMLNRINEERAKVGVAPLLIDTQLSKWARIKSQDMKNNNYFAHNSPTYGTPFEMMRNAGIEYKRGAENISAAQSPYVSHLRLMASAGHRNNILNPNFTHIGIGIIDQNTAGVFVTQLFIQK